MSWREAKRRMDDKWAEIVELDELAEANNQLVGRYIREPFADGYAVYQITKQFEKTVHIQVVTGLGDDWRIPYWGDNAIIERSYAKESITRRMNMRKLFSKEVERA